MEKLDLEQRRHLAKIASPAHVAQYCTRQLPEEARWRPAKHLDVINRKAMEVIADSEQRFLQVAVSVRHGKSELLSVYLILWHLGMFPDREVILISYSEDKAAEWGQKVLNLMVEFGPELFGVTVDGGTTASAKNWKIKGHRGGLRCVGIRGALTGGGASLIVIDDPIKNDEEAGSATARRKMREWYDGTLRSRLAVNGTLLLTMARWHEDDLAGSLLADEDEEMDQWECINMPALAEPTIDERKADDFDEETWRDILGRKIGDALWPEMWPERVLRRIKATIRKRNPQSWDAQYQQNPTPLEGNTFKKANWRWATDVDRSKLRLVRFWDLAASEGRGDWTVGMLVGMDADGITYILEVTRFRAEAAEVERRVKATAEHDGRAVPIRIEQERAGAGKRDISTFVRLLTGWDIAGVKAEGKKEERPDTSGLAAQHQNGRVFIVGNQSDQQWEDLVEEARVFPKGRHDDQVDALDGAFTFLVDMGPTEIVAEELLDMPLNRLAMAGRSMR